MAHPMTFGQLSVWRDIEKMPLDRWWEGNLFFRWAVPGGTSAEQVWSALGALAMRHESLRTTYDISDADEPGQRIMADTVEEVVAAIRQPSGPGVDIARLEVDEVRRAFRITEEVPWRVWLAGPDAAPAEVCIVIHHMAADGAALNIMEREFYALLAGEPLADAPQPSALAERQRDGTDGQLLAAEAYWRKTLAAAPRNPNPPPRGPVLRGTLHTGIAEPMLRHAAQRIGVTPPTVILAAYGVVLARTTADPPLLLFPMSSNRFDPAAAGLVTSMNQWVPLLFSPAPGKPFPAIVRGLHIKSLGALMHGVCDPDVIARVREEADRDGAPIDPGYHFTYLLPPMNVSPPSEITDPVMEWHIPIRDTGPAVYLIVNAHEEINLTLRVIRQGYTREELETVLNGIRELLLELVLGPAA